MDSAPGRAWILALSVAAVVLAGLMFPATGFGTLPADSTGDGPGGAPSDGDDFDEPPPAGSDDRTDVGVTATPSGASSPAAPAKTDIQGTSTPASAPTPTATPTPTTGGGDGSDDERDESLALIPILAVFGAFVSIVAFLVEGKARRWPILRRLPVPAVSVVGLGRDTSQATMAFVVELSTSVPRLVSDLGTATTAAVRGLSTVAGSIGRGLGALALSIPKGLGVAILSAPSGLFGLFSGVGRRDRSSGDAFPTDSGDDGGGPSTSEPEQAEKRPSTVEEAWVSMVERLGLRDWRTKTPRELATIAVDRGFPAEPVHALTDAFRRVVYGGSAASDDRTETALSALERIGDSREGEE